MEATILKFFEGIRTPALTYLFGAFSFLGEGLTVGAVVLLLFWLFGARCEELFLTAVTSAPLNSMMKAGVSRPRPYHAGVVSRLDVDSPLFSTVSLNENFSFPSGHAQATSSALLSASLLPKSGKKRALFLALSFVWVLFVCASRLYFGVHYPSDLLAGVLFGALVAVFWHMVFRYAYDWRYLFLMGLAAVMLVVSLFEPVHELVQMTALIAGAAIFLPLASFLHYDVPRTFPRRLWRIPVGLICVGAIFALTLLFPEGEGFHLLKWVSLTGGGLFLAPVFFKLFKI